MVKRSLPAIAVAAFSLGLHAQTVTLSKSTYPAGAAPRAVLAADFSANGTVDLVVANSGDDTVSVLEGSSASGAFAASSVSRTAAGPQALAAGDFNRDGRVDLAVASAGAGVVSLLWGSGSGAFNTRTDLPAGKTPSSIVVADFNGDGYLDIAAGNSGASSISIFLGDGTGGFRPRVDYPAGASPAALVAADFNRDGRIDLAVANAGDGTVSVVLGQGDGTFASKTDVRLGASPSAAVAADFNADGALDLAVANSGDGSVSVLFGKGDGSFGGKVDLAVGAGPSSIAVADFDGDGQIDLAVSNADANTISLLFGDGTGAFKAGATLATDKKPASAVVLDHLPDGKPDIAVVNAAANSVTFFGNTTTWRTQPPLSRLLSASGAAWGGIVGFNSDGTSYFNYTPDSFQCFGLTTGNYKDSHASVGSNGKMAFESNRDGTGFRIFTVNLDGTAIHQITTTQGLTDPSSQQDRYPVISRDGTKVAFLRRADPTLQYDIYLVKADGTGLRRVTTSQQDPQGKSYSGIYSVAWNPDGTKLAFRGIRVDGGTLHQVLGIVNADGAGEQHLAVWPSLGWQSYVLDWSADGRKILYSGDPVQDPNVYHIIDYPTLSATSIPTATLVAPCTNQGCARLSPDGQWLAYQTANASSGTSPAFIRVAGTGRVVQNLNFAGEALFWGAMQAAGEPDHMEVTPNPVFVSTGSGAAASASLVDSRGNVLVRAVAGWQFPGLNGAAPRIDPAGNVAAGTGLGDWELVAMNAGKKASTTVRVVSPSAAAPTINAVANGATWGAAITSGSWVAILGSGLAGTTRIWRDADIVNGALPTSLEGTQVKINGKAAFVYYASPTQVNVLAPDDDAVGAVPVEVVTDSGRAQASTVLVSFSPGFFAYQQEGGKYAIAQDGQWNLLAKPARR